MALPLRRVLTSVRPTPIPPMPHPVHPYHLSHLSHPDINQPAHKSQCFLIQTIRYDLIQPIRYDPANNTIGSIRRLRYNPADDTIWSSVSSDQKDPSKTHPQLPHCLSIHILYHIPCWYPLILFFTLPIGLFRQKFSLFLCCCIFCCLLCFGFI